MLEIAEETKEYFSDVERWAKQSGRWEDLEKQLNYLATYACHEDATRTQCVLYKDFAPLSFEFVMKRRKVVREASCLHCRHQFIWEVKMSEHTSNLSGEASIHCPQCDSRGTSAGPHQTVYERWFNGGLIFHGNHDGFGNGSAPSFAVTLNPTNGWSIHT